tara:strand:+ start:822 stop:1370 length:549 start_codon:yes stop_codon:yes gene_type:complete
MKGFDILTLFGIGLVFTAGVVVGQGFSFEVKLSDLIALTATIITFVFARNGLKHNDKQYLNSIKPLLDCHITENNIKYIYNFTLKNFGSGSAIRVKYKILYKDEELSMEELQCLLRINNSSGEFKVSTPKNFGSLERIDLIELSLNNRKTYEKGCEILKQVSFEIKYYSLQYEEFKLEGKLY